MNPQSFGQYIRDLRLKKGWTQNDLCEKADITFTYLSKIENNKAAPPSEDVLIRMAVSLGENPHRLIVKAGKVPSDFQQIITSDEDTFQYLERKFRKRSSSS